MRQNSKTIWLSFSDVEDILLSHSNSASGGGSLDTRGVAIKGFARRPNHYNSVQILAVIAPYAHGRYCAHIGHHELYKGAIPRPATIFDRGGVWETQV